MIRTFSRTILVVLMALALAAPIAGTAAGGQTLDRRVSALRPQTGNTNQVVPANAVAPAVSSDSKDVAGRRHNGRIAFEGYPKNAPGNTNEVFTIKPNGDGRKRLTHNKTPDNQPSWSPYGLRLAFGSGRTGVGNEIFTMRHNGGGVRQITHTGLISVQPDWSPSGRRIVYAAIVGNDLELFTIRRDGTHPKRLTHNGYNDYFPDWSPTGNRIVYSASVKPGLDLEIFTIRPNGTDRRQVTHNKTGDLIASYSPSGRRLAIEGKNGIYVRRVAGGGLIQVTDAGAGIYGHSWSPNGKRITYAQDTGHDYEIFTIKVNGTKRHQVTHDSIDAFHPDWGVRRFQ
jgi:Tol biopolymer transport system component